MNYTGRIWRYVVSEIFKQVNQALTCQQVAECLGFTVNSKGFTHSPINKDEKTPSCKIYPGNRGFYDFSSATGGDSLKFASLVLGVDNWQAAQYLIGYFNLNIDTNGGISPAEFEKLKRQREADQLRKAVEKQKWVAEMDNLKATISICENLLVSPRVEPLSDVWCMAVNQRNKAIVKANELVGIQATARDLRLPERPEQRKAG